MKKLSHLLSLCALATALLFTSGCVQNQDPRYVRGTVPRHPAIGSPEWLTWVDHRVDTRYSTGQRADPGSQEWYAIVDYQVFRRDTYNDYYPNSYYGRDGSRTNYATRQGSVRGNYPRGSSRDRYYGPARFSDRDGDYRSNRTSDDKRRRYRLGTIEWKTAVTNIILSGRVTAPPPRSDPWDAPLSPTH